MRILILSMDGDSAGVSHRLVREGHEVDLWVKKSGFTKMLEGIVDRPAKWQSVAPKADLIICDMVGFSHLLPLFQKLGKPVLSCNSTGDMLELDRQKGMEVFQKLGIGIPKTQYFHGAADAAKLEWKSDEGYVLKASGNLDVGKTYLCPTEDIYEWALSTLEGASEIVVQELIPKESSVEVSTEGWFNGETFIHPFTHTWEEKHHMAGRIGKMTGCMGNVVLAFQHPTHLMKATVMKFAPILAMANYRGPIDVNCIVTKDRLYALELTCRMGYDAVEALMTGLKEPMGNLLFDVATGIKKEMDIRYDFLMAIRVTRDPYPFCRPQEVEESDRGMPICGLSEKDEPFTYLCDVFKDVDKDDAEGYDLKYAASDGVVLKATSFGRSVKEAQHRAYKICNNIKAIDISYRNDIGDRVDGDLAKLREWGWI